MNGAEDDYSTFNNNRVECSSDVRSKQSTVVSHSCDDNFTAGSSTEMLCDTSTNVDSNEEDHQQQAIESDLFADLRVDTTVNIKSSQQKEKNLTLNLPHFSSKLEVRSSASKVTSVYSNLESIVDISPPLPSTSQVNFSNIFNHPSSISSLSNTTFLPNNFSPFGISLGGSMFNVPQLDLCAPNNLLNNAFINNFITSSQSTSALITTTTTQPATSTSTNLILTTTTTAITTTTPAPHGNYNFTLNDSTFMHPTLHHNPSYPNSNFFFNPDFMTDLSNSNNLYQNNNNNNNNNINSNSNSGNSNNNNSGNNNNNNNNNNTSNSNNHNLSNNVSVSNSRNSVNNSRLNINTNKSIGNSSISFINSISQSIATSSISNNKNNNNIVNNNKNNASNNNNNKSHSVAKSVSNNNFSISNSLTDNKVSFSFSSHLNSVTASKSTTPLTVTTPNNNLSTTANLKNHTSSSNSKVNNTSINYLNTLNSNNAINNNNTFNSNTLNNNSNNNGNILINHLGQPVSFVQPQPLFLNASGNMLTPQGKIMSPNATSFIAPQTNVFMPNHSNLQSANTAAMNFIPQATPLFNSPQLKTQMTFNILPQNSSRDFLMLPNGKLVPISTQPSILPNNPTHPMQSIITGFPNQIRLQTPQFFNPRNPQQLNLLPGHVPLIQPGNQLSTVNGMPLLAPGQLPLQLLNPQISPQADLSHSHSQQPSLLQPQGVMMPNVQPCMTAYITPEGTIVLSLNQQVGKKANEDLSKTTHSSMLPSQEKKTQRRIMPKPPTSDPLISTNLSNLVSKTTHLPSSHAELADLNDKNQVNFASSFVTSVATHSIHTSFQDPLSKLSTELVAGPPASTHPLDFNHSTDERRRPLAKKKETTLNDKKKRLKHTAKSEVSSSTVPVSSTTPATTASSFISLSSHSTTPSTTSQSTSELCQTAENFQTLLSDSLNDSDTQNLNDDGDINQFSDLIVMDNEVACNPILQPLFTDSEIKVPPL